MRFIPVLLISVALATSAGCFGGDDEPPITTTPTPTGPTTTPTSGATPTTPTSPTPGDTNTTPPKPAPRELCPVSKDFSSQTPAPGATTVTTTGDCGSVAAGYTRIALMGNFTANQGAPAVLTSGVAVKVLDAAGTAVLSCGGPGPGQMAGPVACTGESAATVGAYTLAFEGSGTVTFAGSVTIS